MIAVPEGALADVYLDACRAAPENRLAYVSSDVRLPPIYQQSYGKILLDRPIFLAEEEAVRLGEDLRLLFELLVSLPGRLFGGDLARYVAALGMDPVLAEIMCRGASGRPPLYARADLYHDGKSFRILEYNIGSELGGIDSAAVNRSLLEIPAFRRFAENHGLGYVDTTESTVELLRQAARRVGAGSDPVIVLVEARHALIEHEHVFVALQEAMQRHGVTLRLGEIHQLGFENGKVVLDATPVDVILRYFAAEQLAGDDGALEILDGLLAADADDRTALVTHLDGALFASKGSLGLLHEDGTRSRLSAEEIDLVDRLVPWTRVVGRDLSGGRRADADRLRRYCLANRESLILKRGIGYGGVGTVLGRESTDQEWSEALDVAERGDHVVQQIIQPATEPVLNPDTGEIEHWHANWGVFVTDAGYRGAFVRALQARHGSVISYSNSETRGAPVFTFRNRKNGR